MLEWMVRNKEWLFSGVGVIILLGLLALATRSLGRFVGWWRGRHAAQPKAPLTESMASLAETEISPAPGGIGGLDHPRAAPEGEARAVSPLTEFTGRYSRFVSSEGRVGIG